MSTLSVGPVVPPAAYDLLAQARFTLRAAAAATDPGRRYATAHLAALRAAAAVLAVRARPSGRRRGVWTLLATTAPELAEWAAFFAAGAAKRAAVDTGVPGAVTTREADDLVREAETFLGVATAALDRPVPLAPSAYPSLDGTAGRP